MPKWKENPFTVEFWNERGGIEREMAVCQNLLVARAAYEESCSQYPGNRITLRQGIRVIAEHAPVSPPSRIATPPQRPSGLAPGAHYDFKAWRDDSV